MKDFLKDKTWEDYLIWSIGALLIFGLMLFVIGYMFSFKDPILGAIVAGQKTTISAMSKDTNIFQLMPTLTQGSKEYQMCALAISGFAFIMLDILLFVIIFIWAGVMEWVVPRIKAKKNA